jgi:hypothetical protein
MHKKKDTAFQPLGKWIAVSTDKKGKETTTEHGIIYTEKPTGQYVKSEVLLTGPEVDPCIKVGTTVYWDSKQYKKGNEMDGMHIIHESWIGVVSEP